MGTHEGYPEHANAEPSVDVVLRPPALPSFAAVVALRGEHDLATSADVRAALGPIYGNVLVDLSDCSFIDSKVIGALIGKHRELEREGHRLELLVPPANLVVTRSLSLVGMTSLLVVRDSLPLNESRD
jgi:anti-anti-sigma factor